MGLVKRQRCRCPSRGRHAPQVTAVAEDDGLAVRRDRRVSQPLRLLRRERHRRGQQDAHHRHTLHRLSHHPSSDSSLKRFHARLPAPRGHTKTSTGSRQRPPHLIRRRRRFVSGNQGSRIAGTVNVPCGEHIATHSKRGACTINCIFTAICLTNTVSGGKFRA